MATTGRPRGQGEVEHPRLADPAIGHDQQVGGGEVARHVVERHVAEAVDRAQPFRPVLELTPPRRLETHRVAGHHQSRPGPGLGHRGPGVEQHVESLVLPDVAEEQRHLVLRRQAQAGPRRLPVGRFAGAGEKAVLAVGDHLQPVLGDGELVSQAPAVEPRVGDHQVGEPVDASPDGARERHRLVRRDHVRRHHQGQAQQAQQHDMDQGDRVGAVQVDRVGPQAAGQAGHRQRVDHRLEAAGEPQGEGRPAGSGPSREPTEHLDQAQVGRRPRPAGELPALGGHQGHLVAAHGERPGQVVGVVDEAAAAEGLHLEKPHRRQYGIRALGRLRHKWFGRPADLNVGAEIMALVIEKSLNTNNTGLSE